jgi:hypothetical protein
MKDAAARNERASVLGWVFMKAALRVRGADYLCTKMRHETSAERLV